MTDVSTDEAVLQINTRYNINIVLIKILEIMQKRVKMDEENT